MHPVGEQRVRCGVPVSALKTPCDTTRGLREAGDVPDHGRILVFKTADGLLRDPSGVISSVNESSCRITRAQFQPRRS